MCGMIFTVRGMSPWRQTSSGGSLCRKRRHQAVSPCYMRAGTVWEEKPPCLENNNTANLPGLVLATSLDTKPDKNGGKFCKCNARLSRSLSTPQRCHYCQKIMFFKTYRCKHCRYRCHKKCAGHSHSKSRSCHRSLSGEEHWTKVLQANEVNSNLVVVPCHLSRTAHPAHVAADASPLGGSATGGGKSRHASTITTTTMMTMDASSPKCAKSYSANSYYHSSSARTTNKKDLVDGSPERIGVVGIGGVCTPGSSAASLPALAAPGAASSSIDGRISPNIFSTLYDRLCRWMQTAGVGSRRSGAPGSRSRTPHSLSRSSSVASTKSQDFYQLLHNMPDDFNHGHHEATCIHASMSSEDSEMGSYRKASYSSTCSSLTITSASTACSGDWPNQSNVTDSFPPSNISTGYFNPGGSTPTRKAKTRTQFFSVGSKGIPHTNLTFTISCPLKTKRQSLSGTVTDQRDHNSLCATWPPTGHKTYSNDDEDDVPDAKEELADLDDAVFADPDEPKSWEQREAELRESLREFSIPWKDVESGECLRIGRTTQICRGKWHGDVMVHTFPNVKETEVTRFWEEVAKLSMIRHENVALFMGACIEPPNLAVITSVRRGASLYEQVHIIKDKMSLHTRVHIVRQIAQGMGYLHAKGVVMSKLNSKNIYMEPKVKLCLVDYSMAEKKYERPGYGYVPKGHLTYVAPEVLRTLVVVEPRLVPNAPYTTASDVFAFGTVMFELMTGQFPFRRMPSEVLIWQVGRGFRQSLKHLKYSASLKNVIAQSWAHDPADRPTLTDINKHFQFNGALHKRHSSSEPERLNTSGITAKKTII